MLMTTRLRYAVMFMVSLVQREYVDQNKPRKASSVAEEQSLSEGYLEKIIASLKGRGLVKSTKGPGGGYALAMPPEHITLELLLDSVGERVKMVRCEGTEGSCLSSTGRRCNSHNLWDKMERYVTHYLANTSIMDVFNDNLKVPGADGEYIYADYNAIAEVSSVVRQKLGNAILFENFYNPSSAHKLGQESRRIVENTRRIVLEQLDARGYDVVFTSSGTEANNLVFKSCSECLHVISAVEHASVMNAAVNAEAIQVEKSGVISLEALERILSSCTGSKKVLVSVMVANNETGVLQPVKEVVKLARKYGALVHTDAVQACGKIPLSVSDLGVDFLTVSSHKMGGLSGAGVLLFNSKNVEVFPMMFGGMQEKGLRPGTENVMAIYSLSVALESVKDRLVSMDNVRQMRDLLESKIKEFVPECVIWGQDVDRLPNTTCVSMPGVDSEVQLMGFDNCGIAVGLGSACSSGLIAKSHVLSAMGVSDECIRSVIRISLGPEADHEQVCKIADCWHGIYRAFHSLN